MAFDPDAYLAGGNTGGFNPDAYLSNGQAKVTDLSPSNIGTITKVYGKEFFKDAPEAVGVTLGALASTGAGTLPAMAMQAGGAIAGEGIRQAGSDEQLTPMERAKKLGWAGVRGAVPPALKPAGKWIGNKVAAGAEKISGLSYDTPGVLKEAYKDPSLMFAEGIENARKLYEKAKPVGAEMGDELESVLSKMDFVEKARELAKSGKMNPYEALESRKILDSIKNKVAGPAYHATRDLFDQIAKTAYKGADQAFRRAVKSTALTDIMPKNKTGTPSIGKMILGGIVAPLGAAMSPIVQAGVATTAGAASRAIRGPALANVAMKRLFSDSLSQ